MHAYSTQTVKLALKPAMSTGGRPLLYCTQSMLLAGVVYEGVEDWLQLAAICKAQVASSKVWPFTV